MHSDVFPVLEDRLSYEDTVIVGITENITIYVELNNIVSLSIICDTVRLAKMILSLLKESQIE